MEEVGSKSEGKKKKKKKKLREEEKVKKVWEDICFRCYEDGELLMCDWKNCPKVYHLACLGRDKMPREKWFCPWHHCVEVGQNSRPFLDISAKISEGEKVPKLKPPSLKKGKFCKN